MAEIASEVLIARLADWGVDTVFGLPGDGINGIMEGLRRNADRVRFVLVHHEEAAAFMACAHAKATGKIGVCLATSGPGGNHLANGLYDAKLDHQPVLAITGMQETSVLGTGYQQEVHLDRLYADVAVYNEVVTNPTQLPALVDIAIRTAYARRGVAHLTVPNDIQVAEAGQDPFQHVAPATPPHTAPIWLAPRLTRRDDRAHLAKYQDLMHDWRAKMAALESPSREPIAPQYLAHQLDRLAADDAVLTCDSGTVATWAARHWQIRGGREFYLSGNLASMAPGLPYAIGIQHAYPHRQVIAYQGDGGFAMLMAEFHTAAWHHLPIKVVINDNNSLGQILWEQMVLGYPEHGLRFGTPLPDYAAWAKAAGGFGAHVEKPGDLPVALTEAFAYPGPALVDVAVDPNEPPMPGQVTYEQAKKFAEAFLRGQPHKAAIATTLFKDRIEQLKA